jgi:hypothetical protein
MDWSLISFAVIIGAPVIALALYLRKPFGKPRGTTDFVANKGMGASFMGDSRRDMVERNVDPHFTKKRQ